MKKIGILGGTFDPVHFGHLLIAEQAREHFGLAQVRWIPAAIAPHLQLKNSSEASHRLTMVQLAIAGNSAFIADDRELRRGGKSYTIDTLRELHSENTDSELVLLMGADSLREFHNWRQPSEICRAARVVVVARGGQPEPDMSSLAKFLPNPITDQELRERHLLTMPQLEISSSDLRRRIAIGSSIRYMVPACVDAYITEHGLYRTIESK